MRGFLAACLLLLLAGCGDKAKDLFDTAQLEEKQNNRQIVPRIFRLALRESGEVSLGRVGKPLAGEIIRNVRGRLDCDYN